MKTKKIEEQLNQYILDENNVSEHTLDSAMKALRQNQAPKRHFNFKLTLAPCLIAITAIVLLFSSFMNTNENIYVGDSQLHYGQYDLYPLESIQKFNEEKQKSFLWVSDTEIVQSFAVIEEKTALLICEKSKYDNFIIYEFIVEDIKVMQYFDSCFPEEFISFDCEGVAISCAFEENIAITKFTFMNYVYYFEIKTRDRTDININNIMDIMNQTMKSQSKRLAFSYLF